MNIRTIRYLTFVFLCLLASSQAIAIEETELDNLTAFARLYGDVRFFHPSDAGAEMDWEAFAIAGAEHVRHAATSGDLRQSLLDLFGPIAPTVQIFADGEDPASLVDTAAEGPVVCWQHSGVGLNGRVDSGIYRSIRTGRVTRLQAGRRSTGVATQCLEAGDLRGREIRLRGRVRTEVRGPHNSGHLWLRVDKDSGGSGFFDNMMDRPITTPEWKTFEILGTVADDASQICLGAFLLGAGRIWIDDLVLETRAPGEDWAPAPLANPGFETHTFRSPESWSHSSSGFTIQSVGEGADEGERCLSIRSNTIDNRDAIFAAQPELGEIETVALGRGLMARVPLALGDAQAKDVGPGGKELTALLAAIPDRRDVLDPAVRAGGVIIAWNVLEHFYPYFDVVGTDWLAALPDYLAEAVDAPDEPAYRTALRRLVAGLRDGHGGVYTPGFRDNGPLDMGVDLVEGRLVVVNPTEGTDLQRGDLIQTVDGHDALALLEQEMALNSGSDQWRRKRATNYFGFAPKESISNLQIRRDHKTLDVVLGRRDLVPNPAKLPHPPIEEMETGIWYVDLDAAPMDTINTVMDQLATARGVIFDLRGYPKGNHGVISHLLSEPDTSFQWMQIPQTIYPDRRDVGWQPTSWGMQPQSPHIDGQVVFITDGRAISYAESFMGFIEHYKLGEIVGAPTAGTNGNVNSVNLPGGYRLTYTGMKVLKHDGSRHHLIGIQPTIPMEPTLAGIVAGRDELREKALEIIKERARP